MELSGSQINLRGLDGVQGPIYIGTGCVFNRRAVYGYEAPIKCKHNRQRILSMCFGISRQEKCQSDKWSETKNPDKDMEQADPEVIQEGTEGKAYSVLPMEKKWTLLLTASNDP